MKMPKIKWVVDPRPTGRYGSFFNRGWPDAHYVSPDEKPCFMIKCDTSYEPALAKSGDHKELRLYIADWSDKAGGGTFKWKLLMRRFRTLVELKAEAPKILERLNKFMPEEFR